MKAISIKQPWASLIVEGLKDIETALELVKLEEKYNNWKDIAPTIPYDIKIINKPFGKVLKVSKVEHWVIYLSLSEIERAKYYIVSQLVKWKFDIAGI